MMKVVLISCVFVVTLSACTVFEIGERYSQQIDDELNAYHKQASQFIKSMEQNAGTPQGTFSSAEAKTFYAEASATLANVELQAAVLSPRRCPTDYLQKIASQLAPAALQPEEASGASADNAPQPTGSGTTGNCLSIVVHGVSLAQQDLELDHKDAGKLTPTVGTFNQQQIDAAVRVALTTLRAKKY
jgi:hypothetical protein